MKINQDVKIVLYRFAEKGLEVLMHQRSGGQYSLPVIQRTGDHEVLSSHSSSFQIDLEGEPRAIAVEVNGDFPLDESKIESASREIKSHLQHIISGDIKPVYVAFKGLFKSVLPNEYALLKEFKDILTDRNSVQDI